MSAMIKINPKIRQHFILFHYCSTEKTEYVIDSANQDEVSLENLYGNFEYSNEMQALLTAKYNDLNKTLQFLENLNDLNGEKLFLCLYSNSVFVGMYNKKQTVVFPKITEIYSVEQLKNQKFISVFHDLKAEKEAAKSLIETANQVRDSKQVITRFPPEPSGFLHLGHAKAALLNNYFAEQKQGNLIIRFDDTNPLKEEQLFVDSIIEDLNNLLGIKNYKLSYTSDYFEKIIEIAESLILKGLAYCDNTEKEKMRYERGEGIESENRIKTIEENLTIFKSMVRGENTEYCLRAKIDMQNVNKALRDPVIFRCVDTPHHRTKDQYKVYPTYDFACPIVDSLENVSHAFRTNEYRDRNAQYYWFIKNLDLSHKPKIKDFSRLVFENTVLSKRKLKNIVENNGISWEDPRMPTLRGIYKLGMNFDVLKEYILMQGISQKNIKVSWDKIWAMNKKKIESESEKYFGIENENKILAKIINFEELKNENKQNNANIEEKLENLSLNSFYIKMLKNKKNSELGEKRMKVTEKIYIPNENLVKDEEITLMNLGNFIITDFNEKEVLLKFNKNGNYKTTKQKLQWVSFDDNVECIMFEFGILCKNEEGEFNEDSKNEITFICEKEIENVKEKSVIQIERVGYYFRDVEGFNLVPFTKQARKK